MQQNRADYGAELGCHTRIAWQESKESPARARPIAIDLPLDANKAVIFITQIAALK